MSTASLLIVFGSFPLVVLVVANSIQLLPPIAEVCFRLLISLFLFLFATDLSCGFASLDLSSVHRDSLLSASIRFEGQPRIVVL